MCPPAGGSGLHRVSDGSVLTCRRGSSNGLLPRCLLGNNPVPSRCSGLSIDPDQSDLSTFHTREAVLLKLFDVSRSRFRFSFWFRFWSLRVQTRSELKRRAADVRRDAARRAAAHGALRAAAAAAAARPVAPARLRSHRRPTHLRPVRGLLEQLQPEVRTGPEPGLEGLEPGEDGLSQSSVNPDQ